VKLRTHSTLSVLAAGLLSASNLPAHAGPFDGKTFKGRTAYSADGNHNDPDDWASSAAVLALFAVFGVKDKLVHFDYNSILPDTHADWEKTHADSVLGAAERYGYDLRRFFDCRKDLDGAVASIVKAVNASTAADPLYYIVAGPMQVPVMALQKANPAARRYVYIISHSNWNDGLVTRYKFKNTKRDVIALGVNWVQIPDQNRLLAFSRYGKPALPEEFAPYFWMRDSADAKVRFLWDRMVVSTRPDPSDSGMAYFLMTGDAQADPTKYKRVLEEKAVPQPVGFRQSVRIEAEDFAAFDGYEHEITDTSASHRVGVKLAGGKAAGRITTSFRQPYTAPRGSYDIEVRYFDEQGQRARFQVLVKGKAAGIPWESGGAGGGWTSHTISRVTVQEGDEIAVETAGAPGRLDYVQLDRAE
jgi:hypothetical protein